MQKDAPHALDPMCLEALEQSAIACDQAFVDLQTLSRRISEFHPRNLGNALQPEPEARLFSAFVKGN
jgi:hypothetical protein